MQNKQEILEKLTGISSSRKSYYSELVYLVEEMKKKNRQLAVINELTQIQINATWPQTSSYLAAQLSQILAFEHFALTIVKGGMPASYLCIWTDSDWQCRTLTQPAAADPALFIEQVHQKLTEVLPQHFATSVPLRSQLNQTFGFLTLLHQEKRQADKEETELIELVARHVGVVVENSLLFQDVNEKIKIEAQLIQSAKMAAIGEMAAGIAHELNSPLTAILGNSQLLLRDMADGPTAPLMRDIYQCGVRCKKIIQNLLTFSRQEEYLFETVSIDEVVEDVLGLIGYQLSVSGLTITREMNVPSLLFHGSRHQIEQIVINLLLNARDALADSEAPQIVIRSFLAEEAGVRYVGLSVYDNGTGIPKEQLPQIFQPFFSTKERTKGTGLGLSVSLGIAEAHGGRLFAESEENGYSKFTLLLPLLEREEDNHGAETNFDCR
ncbi:ATP-binding protein [Brevibacillus agri]|uniref:sensor histidine kinase n=1 Tax=Brevibacillus agri TaxID=51101 RepID=UPI0018CDD2A4|nr:ATP-binding protein [Brevibacillus agri]MBG9566503.1 histidine kinase [Brevibacillus agri]MED4572642.1 ATP-binding protein [Brevibacillus agri]